MFIILTRKTVGDMIEFPTSNVMLGWLGPSLPESTVLIRRRGSG